jgi:hypothetical protein
MINHDKIGRSFDLQNMLESVLSNKTLNSFKKASLIENINDKMQEFLTKSDKKKYDKWLNVYSNMAENQIAPEIKVAFEFGLIKLILNFDVSDSDLKPYQQREKALKLIETTRTHIIQANAAKEHLAKLYLLEAEILLVESPKVLKANLGKSILRKKRAIELFGMAKSILVNDLSIIFIKILFLFLIIKLYFTLVILKPITSRVIIIFI